MSDVAYAVKVGGKWVGWEDGDLVSEWQFRAAWDHREYAEEVRSAWTEGGHEARLVKVTRKAKACAGEAVARMNWQTGRLAGLDEAERVAQAMAACRSDHDAVVAITIVADAIAALRKPVEPTLPNGDGKEGA